MFRTFGTFPLAPVSAWRRSFPVPFPSRSRRCVLAVMVALCCGCGGLTVTPGMQADASESLDVLASIAGAGVLPNDPAVVSGLKAADNLVVALGEPPSAERRAVTLGSVPTLAVPPPGATAEEVRRIVEAGQARSAAEAEAAARAREAALVDHIAETVKMVSEPASELPGIAGIVAGVLAALAGGVMAVRRGRAAALATTTLGAVVNAVEASTAPIGADKDVVRSTIMRFADAKGVAGWLHKFVKARTGK